MKHRPVRTASSPSTIADWCCGSISSIPSESKQPSRSAIFISEHGCFRKVCCLAGGLRFQRYPFDDLAPGVIFDGEPGEKPVTSSPEPANRMLAVVENLGVSVTA